MYLTKTDARSSCIVGIIAMASIPSAPSVKWQVNEASRCRWALTSASKISVVTADLFNAYKPLKRAEETRSLIGPRPQRRHSAMMAVPGPGGGVLDRPAVLPGYDNKWE